MVRAVNRSNAGLLIDMLHFAPRAFDSLDDSTQLPREWFHFAHVCDAPTEVPTERWRDHPHRCARRG